MAKVLILGAGYGGVTTAVQLEKAGVPFTLINKHEYHYFTTLLHEPAGGRNRFEEYYVPLRELLRKPTSLTLKDTVLKLVPSQNKVVTDQGVYRYDVLVVALGNAPEYFGIPGMKEYALPLRSLETARTIHRHIESTFASYHTDLDERKLCIVVGGAGLTGVELCGELAEWLPELAAKYGIPYNKVQLINLEAAPTILPMLDEQLREVARDVLTGKGVTLRTGTPIVRVHEHSVELQSGEVIGAATVIWTGGVRANPLIEQAGFSVDARGRALVRETLQSVDHDNVFVIGDSACYTDRDGKPLPPTGQVASQMGDAVAVNVARFLKRRPLEPFSFENMGTLASLGSDVGVGEVKGFKTAGVSAGLMKEASKLKYLWKIGGWRLLSMKKGQVRRKG